MISELTIRNISRNYLTINFIASLLLMSVTLFGQTQGRLHKTRLDQ